LELQVLAERQTSFQELQRCYIRFDERLPRDALLVDSTGPPYADYLSKIVNLLTDRSGQRGESQDATGASITHTMQTNSNVIQAFRRSVEKMLQAIDKEQNLTNRTGFEQIINWTDDESEDEDEGDGNGAQAH
jgi:hypothetical protein